MGPLGDRGGAVGSNHNSERRWLKSSLDSCGRVWIAPRMAQLGQWALLMPPPHWLARGFSPHASSFSSSVQPKELERQERGTKG